MVSLSVAAVSQSGLWLKEEAGLILVMYASMALELMMLMLMLTLMFLSPR